MLVVILGLFLRAWAGPGRHPLASPCRVVAGLGSEMCVTSENGGGLRRLRPLFPGGRMVYSSALIPAKGQA